MFHEGERSACVKTSDGVAEGGDVFLFDTVDYHVAKGCSDVAEDVVFVRGKTV